MSAPRRYPANSIDLAGDLPFGANEYLFYLVFQAQRQRDLGLNRVLKPTGLDTERWRTLAVIRRIADCTMTELSRFSAIDRTTLTRSVDQLVRRGLVERSTPPTDRRRVVLTLTEAGSAIYNDAIRVMMTSNTGLLDGVDEAEVRIAIEVLRAALIKLTPDAHDAEEVLAFSRLD